MKGYKPISYWVESLNLPVGIITQYPTT